MKTLRPYITEKSVSLTKENKYTLVVDYNATKKDIISEIKKFYKVSPISVNSLKTKYLKVSKNKKESSDRGMKKIIVQLSKDQKIAGFDFETKKEDEKKEVKKEKTEKKKVKDVKES